MKIWRLKDKNCKSNYDHSKHLRDEYEDAKYDIKIQNMGEQSEKCRSFRMCLNISGYWLKQVGIVIGIGNPW